MRRPSELSKREPEKKEAPVKKTKLLVLSFKRGLAWGPSGLRQEYLRAPGCGRRPVIEDRVLDPLREFCSAALNGTLPAALQPFLCAGTLVPLKKKDKGLRPLVVGEFLRALVGKLVAGSQDDWSTAETASRIPFRGIVDYRCLSRGSVTGYLSISRLVPGSFPEAHILTNFTCASEALPPGMRALSAYSHRRELSSSVPAQAARGPPRKNLRSPSQPLKWLPRPPRRNVPPIRTPPAGPESLDLPAFPRDKGKGGWSSFNFFSTACLLDYTGTFLSRVHLIFWHSTIHALPPTPNVASIHLPTACVRLTCSICFL